MEEGRGREEGRRVGEMYSSIKTIKEKGLEIYQRNVYTENLL